VRKGWLRLLLSVVLYYYNCNKDNHDTGGSVVRILKINAAMLLIALFLGFAAFNSGFARQSWQSVPDVQALIHSAQDLINHLDAKEITRDQGQAEAQNLYAELERAITFERSFKTNLESQKKELIEKAEYLMLQLSSKFALTTPIEKLKQDYEGAVSWLSASWSKLKGIAQSSLDTVMQQAMQGKAWAIDQVGYIADTLSNTLSLDIFVKLIENFEGKDKVKQILKETYMKAKGFIEPSPEIKEIAEYAMKQCGIDPEKVILLEDPKAGRSYNAYVNDELPYSFMVITSLWRSDKDSVKSKIFTAFHECGHIYYRHSTKRDLAEGISGAAGIVGLALPLAHFGYKMTKKDLSVGLKEAGFVAEALLTFALYLLWERSTPFYHRLQEKEADLFACDRLIAAGRPDIVVRRIEERRVGNTKNFEREGMLAQLKSSEAHPSIPEQVAYLIDCLKKHGYSLDVPKGSYHQSCADCFRHTDTLYCQCSPEKKWYDLYSSRRTHLDTLACKGADISNCEGNLKCGPC
jgi:hypothetical protein